MEREREGNLIYHERQRLQFCLLHSLNNLFQEKDAFTRSSLNAVAEKLDLYDPNKAMWTPMSAIFKPHHNSLTGNYDINVLMAALEERGKKVTWHDRRLGTSSIDLDGTRDELFGIVLNIPVRRYGGIWRSRHWVALRRIDGVWYNLDSDLPSPYPFKNVDEVTGFIDSIVSTGGGSLRKFLHQQEPYSLPLNLTLKLALDIARGMQYLHAQGILHRDLKPKICFSMKMCV